MSQSETIFLREFHNKYPGCTSQAYSRGRCKDHAKSSYELLAELPSIQEAILDLGCGDGYLLDRLVQRGHVGELVGLDSSPDELIRCGSRALGQVQWIRGSAHAIALPSHQFDWIISHFAFHIISEPEKTISEIHRILLPEGTFASIVGGGPKIGDSFELFLAIARPFIIASPAPPLGDSRCNTESGLRELFNENEGWGSSRIDDHAIDLSGSFEQVWQSLSTIYSLAYLSIEQWSQLRSRFQGACVSHYGEESIPCSMFVRRIRISKAK